MRQKNIRLVAPLFRALRRALFYFLMGSTRATYIGHTPTDCDAITSLSRGREVQHIRDYAIRFSNEESRSVAANLRNIEREREERDHLILNSGERDDKFRL